MEHRIVELASFKLVGFKKESTNANRQGMKDCPAFWNEIVSAGKQESLLPMINHEPFGLIGASFYNVDDTDAQKFDYYIAVATTNDTPADLYEVEVPANMWAVFPCTRKTSGKTQFAIVSKWAPQSTEYELLNEGYMTGEMISGGPDLEVYGRGDDIEIWVPVRKK
ncbi:GyrI-like domain-containing protein [Candidatus Enterococcus murrayae]|uniref:AraC family transcriptional regulator n=1 Tax=Candidatus Enterococcus murrayae TaxID=2815321 RepID=A0ABS3HNN4_9ENTE|nr:GyrI-like domain-containing protein [Enterococcus sp. MJM16]MBO0455045.1 AraC family transcriptional regulator [Enterococcus sp. MJM16]